MEFLKAVLCCLLFLIDIEHSPIFQLWEAVMFVIACVLSLVAWKWFEVKKLAIKFDKADFMTFLTHEKSIINRNAGYDDKTFEEKTTTILGLQFENIRWIHHHHRHNSPFWAKAFFRSFCQLSLFLAAFLPISVPQLRRIFRHTIFPSQFLPAPLSSSFYRCNENSSCSALFLHTNNMSCPF